MPTKRALFAITLALSGARIGEVLAIKPSAFQVDCGVVAIQTLKRRRHHVREVRRFYPAITAVSSKLPDARVMRSLDAQYGVAAMHLLAEDRVELKRYIARLA